MTTKKRILVTSALPYANGPIHLGHLAGAYLPADIFVRYHRLKGSDVLFICGSDEHGVPIMLRAKQEGIEPQAIVDYYHDKNRKSFKEFGINFDYYGRTTSKLHEITSQEFFRTLANKNVFVIKKDKQLFDAEAKIFLADRFVRGTCPKPDCGYEDAYGDQCEKCGSSLNPTDLINPKSVITNSKPVLRESQHWYLPLEKFQSNLEKWIAQHPEWKSNVLGQIRSWFEHGLKDRAVTRDLTWGVPVPSDIAEKEGIDASGKVLYVWFDAPIGYISATKEWAISQGKPELWKKYWQDKETRLIHFIGKDNIVFHCIIFPMMLNAHGEFILPDNVPANEFLNLEGNKLSTSRDFAVWLEDYLENFNPDSLRYCLANNLPESKDADFSWRDFQSRHNNELADILGNFVNRTLTFTEKYFEAKVPQSGKFSTIDQNFISNLRIAPVKIAEHINAFQLRAAVKEMMDIARAANKYFNDQKPWETIKSDKKKCATTIYICLEAVRYLSIIFDPIIPFTCKKIRVMLNLNSENIKWEEVLKFGLTTDHPINRPEILFTKIEDKEIKRELGKLKLIDKESAESEILIDDFNKLDLRVGEIISVEPLQKADRLLKLQVKIGTQQRSIIAGIAEHYGVNELIGKKIIVLTNLKPANIRGEISQGMLLAAKFEGKLCLVTIDGEIDSGATVS